MPDCACGQPLHYRDANGQRSVQELVDTLGPDVIIETRGRSWRVPRHYIALHGLKAWELPRLAAALGFDEL